LEWLCVIVANEGHKLGNVVSCGDE
jgi:hypothetical protein